MKKTVLLLSVLFSLLLTAISCENHVTLWLVDEEPENELELVYISFDTVNYELSSMFVLDGNSLDIAVDAKRSSFEKEEDDHYTRKDQDVAPENITITDMVWSVAINGHTIDVTEDTLTFDGTMEEGMYTVDCIVTVQINDPEYLNSLTYHTRCSGLYLWLWDIETQTGTLQEGK